MEVYKSANMYYGKDSVLFLDGKFVKAEDAKLNLFQQSLHYGNAIFEGIRAYDTPDGPKVFKARQHYERLLASAKKMYLQIPYTVEELIETSYSLLSKNNLSFAYIRPLVFAGTNMGLTPAPEIHLMIATWEWGRYLGDDLLRVITSTYQRPNPKSIHVEAKVAGHYVNSILATSEAKSKGYDEALLLDSDGFVAQGPGANVFYEKNEVLYTPPKGNILPGITRSVVIEMARELGVKVKERKFILDEMKDADAAFYTGTAIEVMGLQSLDDHKFPVKWEDSLGYILSRMYRQTVTNKGHNKFSLV